MGGGFGFRDWNATLPSAGEDWRERGEFNELSDRAYAEQLRIVRDAGAVQRDAVVLISVIRNEALRLPTFFEHYRRLGVARFFMIDNDSEDESIDLMLAEPTATVFHTSASFRDSCCGIYWLNGIARARCVGHWTLMSDADELLVYDRMDDHDLSALGCWLDRNAQDRLFAPMIDVYPQGAVGETRLSVKDNLERNSWLDPTGYALQRRVTGWLVTGGPRQRLFSNKPSLLNGEWSSKYPFFRMNEDTAVLNAHFIWPHMHGPPRPFGTLLHLKFMDDFAERVARNVREGEHYDNAVRYRAISERLAQAPRQVVFHAGSVRYLGPESLIQHRLMLPIQWKVADGVPLPHLRTLGGIGYRQWAGIANRRVMSPGEREEFEDFSLRAFESQMSIVRCRGRLAEGEIGLICVLRNEAARLPLFFEHYKALGVSRFFMIDNNSDDGSRDLLLAEPQVDVFHAHALFSEGQGGLYWAQAVARHYGEGNWLIRPDADELFVYDGMEERDLARLASWLEKQGMDRIYAPMIDLYPSSSLGSSTETITELLRTDSWFDNDGYVLKRWPHGWYLTGGPRHRVFNQEEKAHMGCMWKYPFFRMGPETTLYNHHWIWPDDTVTTGALGAVVHLKLMHDFIERSRRYEHEGQHWNQSRAYQLINKRLQEMPQAMIFYEGSKRYRGPRSLIRHGMMQPIDWDA